MSEVQSFSGSLVDVIAERSRQMEKEGYTSAHDDSHKLGEMAKAASVYASVAATCTAHSISVPPCFRAKDWPWDKSSFKASNPRRMLIKAAALILAEIDRIDRQEASC